MEFDKKTQRKLLNSDVGSLIKHAENSGLIRKLDEKESELTAEMIQASCLTIFDNYKPNTCDSEYCACQTYSSGQQNEEETDGC